MTLEATLMARKFRSPLINGGVAKENLISMEIY